MLRSARRGSAAMLFIKKMLVGTWNNIMVQWIVRTAYYLIIILALLWLYGIDHNSTPNTFIYNNF
jgi:hypothetical protein